MSVPSANGSSRPGRASRRLQRSVRVVVAATLLVLAAVTVVGALLASSGVGVAAVLALFLGAVAARIIWAEAVRSRRDHAIERARMARDFGAAMTTTFDEHREFTAAMADRLADRERTILARDLTIVRLKGTLQRVEKRAVDAEARVTREAKRANQAQERLSVLLSEVLTNGTGVAEDWDSAGIPEAAALPSIDDLLAWEDQIDQPLHHELRHQA
jgi:hypothetical protein